MLPSVYVCLCMLVFVCLCVGGNEYVCVCILYIFMCVGSMCVSLVNRTTSHPLFFPFFFTLNIEVTEATAIKPAS